MSSLLSEIEVAETLGVSRRTLQGWRQRGQGPTFVKLTKGQPGRVRYRAAAVERFLAEREAQSTAQSGAT